MRYIISTDRTTVFFRALILILSFACGIWLIWSNSAGNPYILRWNSWAFYEWLINYEGGFVRRGLIGALIDKTFYGNEVFVINFLVFFIATSFFFLMHVFIFKNNSTYRSALVYIFSPIGSYWIAVGNEYYYRKEIIFLLLAVAVCFFFRKIETDRGGISEKALSLVIILMDMLLPLIHEAFIFFNGLFFALILLALNGKDPVFRRVTVWLHVALCLVIFVGLSFYKGDLTTSAMIWRSLSSAALMNGGIEPSGAIAAIGWSSGEAMKLSILTLASGLGGYYLWPLLLTYLAIGFIAAEQRGIEVRDFYTSTELTSTFGAVCLTFSPLFLLGWDWGRWVFGIAYISLFILTLKIEEPIVQFWGSRGHRRFLFVNAKRPFALFAVILLIGVFTRSPECCFSASGTSLLSNPTLSELRRGFRSNSPVSP